jgi:hypothetical protein
MSMIKTGNATHDNNCYLSEMQRQATVAAATTQAQVTVADRTHFRNCLASAKTNGCGLDPFLNGLRELGTWV